MTDQGANARRLGVAQRVEDRPIERLTDAEHKTLSGTDDRSVTSNPVAKLGRFVTAKEVSSAHINPLSTLEVRRALDEARDRFPLFYPLLLCALRTGMRRGGLLGLQWGDIDFAGQFIEVRWAVVRRQVTSTKTHKIRRVDMSPPR